MAARTPSLPAGWYPDQLDPGLLRYWDGGRWTEHTHPAPSPQPRLPPPAGLGRTAPWWQTWWAIVPALLFCFPVGLVFLWMRKDVSGQVKSVVTAAVAVMVIVIALSGDADPEPDDAIADNPSAAAPESLDDVGQTGTEDEADEEAKGEAVTKPERTRVPGVVATRLPRARARLRTAGLTMHVTERMSWEPAGVVLGQSLAAGAKVASGKTVRVVVAAPMPLVPGVVGRTAATATSALRDAGFTVATTTQAVTTGAGGLVLRQAPAGTAQAEPGALVTLVISNEVQPIAPLAPASCTPGYSPCVPPAPDYDCAGGSGDGPRYAGPVRVTGTDPYDLDADGDGLACGGD